MLRELWSHYRDERTRLAVLVGLGVATALAEVGTLLALAPLMQATAEGADRYVGDAGPFSVDIAVAELALIAGVLVVVALAAQMVFASLAASTTAALGARKRAEVMDAFTSATWAAQQHVTGGQLVALTGGHALQHANGLTLLARLLRAAISVTIFVAASLAISFVATLIVVAAMGAVYAALRQIRRATQTIEQQRSLNEVEMSEEVNAIHRTAREAAAFGTTESTGTRYGELNTDLSELSRRAQFLSDITSPLYRSAGLLLLVGMIAYVAQTRALEIAAIAVVALMLYRSLGHGQQLAATAQKLAGVPPFLDRLDETISELRQHPVVEGDIDVHGVHTISLDDVAYRYADAPATTLDGVTLSLHVGEVVGVVGPSGAGKSTLAELLLALRHPTTGTVRFDGVDVRDLTHRSRSRLTAIVSQSVPVISGTVRDNVRFFRDLDDATVDEAITRVGLTGYVDELPDGPDTVLGDHGRGLSGGQLQRIGIARALAGGPNLIVLDEPTSALDAAAESVITELTDELRSDAAVVVIAHRLTTLRHCDRLVVIDDGCVAGTGTLDELRARNDFVDHAYRVGTL